MAAGRLVGPRRRGGAAAIEQLQGVAIPASAWEHLVLPARVADYSPAFLDEICASGEVVWAGSGSIPGGDGWISFAWAESAPLLLPPTDPDFASGPLHQVVLEALTAGQALFFRQLCDQLGLGGPGLSAVGPAARPSAA
jgi:ATP-dependent Lhr-like helicase